MADEKIIFSMVGVSKTFTNQKKVLNNIYLSFFYGAKIGIIGLNGSGKSTLMKIIAGIDKNFQGEVVFSPGYTVGYLEQEPRLDNSKTVRQVVEEGCAETVALLKEYEEINMKLCEPMTDDEMNALIREDTISYLFHVKPQAPIQREMVAKPTTASHGDGTDTKKPVRKSAEEKNGRNDPCPCGSGKKYKNCCMGKE